MFFLPTLKACKRLTRDSYRGTEESEDWSPVFIQKPSSVLAQNIALILQWYKMYIFSLLTLISWFKDISLYNKLHFVLLALLFLIQGQTKKKKKKDAQRNHVYALRLNLQCAICWVLHLMGALLRWSFTELLYFGEHPWLFCTRWSFGLQF